MIIRVVFLNKNKRGSKIYDFRCHYAVEVGDIIQDPRYSSPMLVVGLADKSSISDDLLKTIIITKINKKENIMEKRNIQISLEQAREWYFGNNDALKRLALTVYTENELAEDMEYILKAVDPTATIILASDINKIEILAKLEIVAKYYNKDWKKTASNTGYFIGKSSQGFTFSVTTIPGLNNVGIVEHNTVMYPGIIYFKNKEDLMKAIKLVDIKPLFE